MMIGINLIGQMNGGDNSWEPVITEMFTGNGRGWNSCFKENTTNPIWCVYCPELRTGVAYNSSFLHQAFQTSHSLFNNETFSDNKMRLVATYKGPRQQDCGIDYVIPNGNDGCNSISFNCDVPPTGIYYHSGNIQTIHQNCHFGYYEVRCSMPTHRGVHASFWLWGGDNDYEEIDIMEYSEIDCQGDYTHGYSSGIWYNPNGTDFYGHNIGKQYVHTPQSEPNIGEMHIYGCEWLPDRVIFSRDGKVMKEYLVRDSIPQNKKWLKMGYTIDDYGVKTKNENGIWVFDPWEGSDTLVVDYIKYCRLKTDCNTDEYVHTFQQFNQLNNVKRSITISNPTGLLVPSGTEKTIRATEHITVNGPFEMPAIGELTLIVHECPNTD